jgi:hypothetical protein
MTKPVLYFSLLNLSCFTTDVTDVIETQKKDSYKCFLQYILDDKDKTVIKTPILSLESFINLINIVPLSVNKIEVSIEGIVLYENYKSILEIITALLEKKEDKKNIIFNFNDGLSIYNVDLLKNAIKNIMLVKEIKKITVGLKSIVAEYLNDYKNTNNTNNTNKNHKKSSQLYYVKNFFIIDEKAKDFIFEKSIKIKSLNKKKSNHIKEVFKKTYEIEEWYLKNIDFLKIDNIISFIDFNKDDIQEYLQTIFVKDFSQIQSQKDYKQKKEKKISKKKIIIPVVGTKNKNLKF